MRILKYAIGAILVLYLQVLIAPRLEIYGIEPFFLLPFVIFISMKLKFVEAVTITFIMALAIDVLDTFILGTNTALLLIISYLVEKYHTSVTKDKFGPVMISILLLNLTFFIPYLVIRFLVFGFDNVLLTLFPLELVYNSIVTILFIIVLSIVNKMRVVIDV